MSKNFGWAVSFCVAFLTGCVTPQKTADELTADGYRQLNAEEIVAMLSGNTLNGNFIHPTYGASSVTLFVGADGSLSGEISAGTQKRDTGTWEARPPGLLCDRYTTWQAGYDCDWVYVRGSEYALVNKDGTLSSKGQIEPGNSKGL